MLQTTSRDVGLEINKILALKISFKCQFTVLSECVQFVKCEEFLVLSLLSRLDLSENRARHDFHTCASAEIVRSTFWKLLKLSFFQIIVYKDVRMCSDSCTRKGVC